MTTQFTSEQHLNLTRSRVTTSLIRSHPFTHGHTLFTCVQFIYTITPWFTWDHSVHMWPTRSHMMNLFARDRPVHMITLPGAVARSEASSLGMQAAPSLIPTSDTFFRGDLVMKTFLRPFSLFRWFKDSSCQLLAKECALSTGKLARRLAQEQCG